MTHERERPRADLPHIYLYRGWWCSWAVPLQYQDPLDFKRNIAPRNLAAHEWAQDRNPRVGAL